MPCVYTVERKHSAEQWDDLDLTHGSLDWRRNPSDHDDVGAIYYPVNDGES